MLMWCNRGSRILIPFILSAMIALSGCGQEEASGGVTDVADALFLSGNETGAAAETVSGDAAAQNIASDTAASQGKMPNAAGAQGKAADASGVSSVLAAPTESADQENARKLTDEECRALENFLNEEGSYGFLLSVYEKPQDLDAAQVFYMGAGLAEPNVPEEEREAYLEQSGEDEAPNLFRLSAQQVSDHLQYRAGISLEDLTTMPDWVYLEEYGAFYQAHGDEDTNVCRFEVTDAAVQGGYYRVHYRNRRYKPQIDGRHISVYEVILKKNGDGYRFCANRLWMEKDLLLRPFCSVEIEPYGQVLLCAYKPDGTAAENADVTFELIRDGKTVAVLPGANDENMQPDMIFEDVVAVDTGDYDGDGAKEIMTISRYRITKHGNSREDGREARIYRIREDGTPELDAMLSRKINRNVKELTITGIASYIKTGKDRGPFATREEAFAAEIEAVDPEAYDKFALINIDDNRDPELVEIGKTPDKGAKILFFNNGVLQETKVSRDFSYLNKENLLYSRTGTQNLFNEALYLYKGGSFDIYLSGTYGTMDAASTAYGKDGKPEYLYTWEGSSVTEAGYRDALEFVYNRQRAVAASAIETVSAEEMLVKLKGK